MMEVRSVSPYCSFPFSAIWPCNLFHPFNTTGAVQYSSNFSWTKLWPEYLISGIGDIKTPLISIPEDSTPGAVAGGPFFNTDPTSHSGFGPTLNTSNIFHYLLNSKSDEGKKSNTLFTRFVLLFSRFILLFLNFFKQLWSMSTDQHKCGLVIRHLQSYESIL